MAKYYLAGILTLLALLIGIDLSQREVAAMPPGASTPADSNSASTSGSIAPHRPLGLLPGVLADAPGAPTIDLMARLAIRRRLEREGNRVYLDSLLAATDSVLTRWEDRPEHSYFVLFVADTAVAGFSAGALDDARAGMRLWSGNAAGLVLVETQDTAAADIRVVWVPTLADSTQLGVSRVQWSQGGAIQSAVISLAIGRNPEPAVLPSALRRRVAAHEFGHALGLPHSDTEDDLMFSTSPQAAPSRRDQASLQLLYSVPPGPLRVQ